MSSPPVTPSAPANFHRLRFLAVIGGFLDGQTFDFSEGLNCLIGARGTGKTTLLELVRYALDVLPDHEDNPAERRRIEALVKRNLNGGRIQVGIATKDGLSYVVSRSWGEEPIVLSADGSPTEVTLRSGGVFKADIYSQNEVEGIADRSISQLSLIDNFEARSIAEIEAEIRHVCASLDASASQIAPLQSRLATLGEELSTLPNVEARLAALSATTGEDSAEINRAHGFRALRDREHRAVGSAGRALDTLQRDLTSLKGKLGHEAGLLVDPEISKGPNGAILAEIPQILHACAREVEELLDRTTQRVAAARQDVAACAGKISVLHKEQELAFRSLIEKHQQAQGQAAERMQLEKLRNDLLAKKRTREELRQRLATVQQERIAQLERLSELRDRRFAIRKAVADRINESLSPAIRVTMTQYGNPECYRQLLEESLRGTRIKYAVVAQKMVGAFWPAELSAVIRNKDVQALVDKAELNQDQADKVIDVLAGSEVLYDLETVELLDQPRIELKDGDCYKDSNALSTGQKCTAILPILLMDSHNPLLVDQPEDNLDNRFIFETVVGSIRRIKSRRQLIFVTHNPNIPVLADAERVFVLDSDGSASHKANEGTVDHCKNDIVTLLEGGEEAFKRRKERYAY